MEGILNLSCRQAVFKVSESGDIAMARRAGLELARRLKFDENRTSRLAFIITEAATNVVRHAARGEIIIRSVAQGTMAGIEVLALDSGPGIEDGKAYAGNGLSAIRQQTDDIDLYSSHGQGTVLWMRLWAHDPGDQRSEWDVGVVCLPIESEQECGDAWEVVTAPDSLYAMVADGLGHGPDAARASQAAVNVLGRSGDVSPAAVLNEAHHALTGTRGAAVAVVHIRPLDGKVCFAGVGNIEGQIVGGKADRHTVSHNGIIGSNIRKIQEFTYPWEHDSMLIMHSDGLGTRWGLSSYPGLNACHPAVIAAVLYRDFVRRRDDVIVLVLRQAAKRQSSGPILEKALIAQTV
jgi:anti-sigma regulatory factor (Ser/Thr protein kinase)